VSNVVKIMSEVELVSTTCSTVRWFRANGGEFPFAWTARALNGRTISGIVNDDGDKWITCDVDCSQTRSAALVAPINLTVIDSRGTRLRLLFDRCGVLAAVKRRQAPCERVGDDPDDEQRGQGEVSVVRGGEDAERGQQEPEPPAAPCEEQENEPRPPRRPRRSRPRRSP
jgi:hypothetical protein